MCFTVHQTKSLLWDFELLCPVDNKETWVLAWQLLNIHFQNLLMFGLSHLILSEFLFKITLLYKFCYQNIFFKYTFNYSLKKMLVPKCTIIYIKHGLKYMLSFFIIYAVTHCLLTLYVLFPMQTDGMCSVNQIITQTSQNNKLSAVWIVIAPE